MLQILKNGNEIRSVDDWFTLAPPKKKEQHWKDGRSAKELAKSWFPDRGGPRIPRELTELFESHEAVANTVWHEAEPERVTQFDNCGPEYRNADLVLWGKAGTRRVVASVEAKADEEFGRPAGQYVDSCSSTSRVPERFALLCEGVLGLKPTDEKARRVQYQLLTGVAGALCDADEYQADASVFVVHEFTGATSEEKLRRNTDALNHFIRLVSRGTIDSIPTGQLVGPVSVPGNQFFCACESLLIGKCHRAVVVDS